MKGTLIAAVICLIANMEAASADFMTGNDLHSQCAASDTIKTAICAGYIGGAASVLIDFDASIPGTRTRLCVPQQAQVGQIVDVVKAYLTAHPETRHQSAWVQVSLALRQAFPCQ